MHLFSIKNQKTKKLQSGSSRLLTLQLSLCCIAACGCWKGALLTLPQGCNRLSGTLRAVGPPGPVPKSGWPDQGCGQSSGAETVGASLLWEASKSPRASFKCNYICWMEPARQQPASALPAALSWGCGAVGPPSHPRRLGAPPCPCPPASNDPSPIFCFPRSQRFPAGKRPSHARRAEKLTFNLLFFR